MSITIKSNRAVVAAALLFVAGVLLLVATGIGVARWMDPVPASVRLSEAAGGSGDAIEAARLETHATAWMLAAGDGAAASATVDEVLARSKPDLHGNVVLVVVQCFGHLPSFCRDATLVTQSGKGAPEIGDAVLLLRDHASGRAAVFPLPSLDPRNH